MAFEFPSSLKPGESHISELNRFMFRATLAINYMILSWSLTSEPPLLRLWASQSGCKDAVQGDGVQPGSVSAMEQAFQEFDGQHLGSGNLDDPRESLYSSVPTDAAYT